MHSKRERDHSYAEMVSANKERCYELWCKIQLDEIVAKTDASSVIASNSSFFGTEHRRKKNAYYLCSRCGKPKKGHVCKANISGGSNLNIINSSTNHGSRLLDDEDEDDEEEEEEEEDEEEYKVDPDDPEYEDEEIPEDDEEEYPEENIHSSLFNSSHPYKTSFLLSAILPPTPRVPPPLSLPLSPSLHSLRSLPPLSPSPLSLPSLPPPPSPQYIFYILIYKKYTFKTHCVSSDNMALDNANINGAVRRSGRKSITSIFLK